MDGVSALVLGIALWFNFVIIYYKVKHGNILNGIFDAVILILIMWLTAGSLAGLSIGTIASALFSIYLVFDPIKGEIVVVQSVVMTDAILHALPFKWAKKLRKKRKKKKEGKTPKTKKTKVKKTRVVPAFV